MPRHDDSYQRLLDDLIARRQHLGISQDALNEVLGVADRLVAKWECRLSRPSLYMLSLWCEALGLQGRMTPETYIQLSPKRRDRTTADR